MGGAGRRRRRLSRWLSSRAQASSIHRVIHGGREEENCTSRATSVQALKRRRVRGDRVRQRGSSLAVGRSGASDRRLGRYKKGGQLA
eukprot:825910-Prorocentrum_minimum.AAC.1